MMQENLPTPNKSLKELEKEIKNKRIVIIHDIMIIGCDNCGYN